MTCVIRFDSYRSAGVVQTGEAACVASTNRTDMKFPSAFCSSTLELCPLNLSPVIVLTETSLPAADAARAAEIYCIRGRPVRLDCM